MEKRPNRILEMRRRAGMSREELAYRAGVPFGSLLRYEQGRTAPFVHVAIRIAKALGTSVEDLFPSD